MSIDIDAARKSFQARLQKEQEKREKARQKVLDVARSTIPDILAKYPTIQAVYLFGSILRPGAFTQNSDIDIAIQGGSAKDYFAFWHDMEDALPDWSIDLRHLPPNTYFTKRIQKTGEQIYGRESTPPAS